LGQSTTELGVDHGGDRDRRAHRTETLDHITMLSGEIDLELDTLPPQDRVFGDEMTRM
jgi:hypothetical protein